MVLECTPSAISRMVKRGDLTPAQVIPTGRAGVFVFRRADVLAYKRRRARKAAAGKRDAAPLGDERRGVQDRQNR